MENEHNKKSSGGKRVLKKVKRRRSNAHDNTSQSSDLDDGLGTSRSKSSKDSHLPVEINDCTPHSTPDGTKDKANRIVRLKSTQENTSQHSNIIKKQDLPAKGEVTQGVHLEDKRNQNVQFQEVSNTSNTSQKNTKLPNPSISEHPEPSTTKKGLKRKLEEDSGAGTSGASTGTSDTDADDKDPSKDKKKKNRCAVCRKKVGLTGFECRCGGLFCAVHRYSDKHECSFDYRELGAQEIRRNNPVVVSQKIHKI